MQELPRRLEPIAREALAGFRVVVITGPREELDESGVSPTEFARQIDVPPNRIGQIIAGKRSVTADTALRFGHWFGVEAQFWLNLQTHADFEVRQCLAHPLGNVRAVQRDAWRFAAKAASPPASGPPAAVDTTATLEIASRVAAATHTRRRQQADIDPETARQPSRLATIIRSCSETARRRST